MITTHTLDARESDRIALALIAELQEAWNAGDGTAFAAPFTDDAVFVNILGMVGRGPAEIAAGHDQIFSTIYAGSRLQVDLLGTRMLADDVIHALVHADLHIPAGPLAGDMSAVGSHVLVHTDAGWKISVFHNTTEEK